MKQILLIEDNRDIRENTVEILELAGYRVAVAVNGSEGIDMATQLLPDIILCDVQMPVMDGLEVFRNLKANPQCAKIPFVFVTASAEKREIETALAMGADGYVCKPFEASELLDVVRHQMESNGL
jgi:CheY-like chemotaxis protein